MNNRVGRKTPDAPSDLSSTTNDPDQLETKSKVPKLALGILIFVVCGGCESPSSSRRDAGADEGTVLFELLSQVVTALSARPGSK